jgi:predicted nucleic acid-binding protein
VGRQAVVNASPLIFLSRGQHMELFRTIADHLIIPQPVADEILRRGPSDATVSALGGVNWIEIVPVTSVANVILEWGLGAGESAVLAYAFERPGTEVIIDDMMGRKCAGVLNIPVRGTLGIVLKAKKDGHIGSARSVLEDLIRNGMYLSRPMMKAASNRRSPRRLRRKESQLIRA